MQSIEVLTVRSFRANGHCYRWWSAQPILHNSAGIVADTPPGIEIFVDGGPWTGRYQVRAYYWFDRPYNLLEVYEPDGRLVELYVHIASPARVQGTELHYVDHELDVVLFPGEQPVVVDEDEFQAAIVAYGYTAEFQAQCRRACEEAMALVTRWQVDDSPQRALNQF